MDIELMKFRLQHAIWVITCGDEYEQWLDERIDDA